MKRMENMVSYSPILESIPITFAVFYSLKFGHWVHVIHTGRKIYLWHGYQELGIHQELVSILRDWKSRNVLGQKRNNRMELFRTQVMSSNGGGCETRTRFPEPQPTTI